MNNKKLEQMLNEMKAKQENPSQEFIELLKASNVIVPALMPKNTSPEIIRQMMQNPGQPQKIPAGANPQPCVLENANGKRYLAIFTSEDEAHKGNDKTPKFPITLNLPFENCIGLIRSNSKIDGAVINPFTHNVIFHVQENAPQEKPVQLTVEQFHHLSRQKMEAFYLPKTLFEKKAEVFEKLRDEQGVYLKELYEEVYDTEIACPYVAEDFEFMCLNISDELSILRITMPQKYTAIGTCPCVIIGWNEKEQKIWYYGIVIAQGKTQLHQRMEDGTDVNLGDAPAEGNELTTVLDLIQGA